MPFLDWVNKAQAQRTSANVPYHLLQFQSAHGDPAAVAHKMGRRYIGNIDPLPGGTKKFVA